MTTLTVTPTAAVDCKKAVLVGCVAVREQVSVTLVGLGSRITEGLVLRVITQTTYPTLMAVCEEWTSSGIADVDAIGTLNLNTELLVAAMAGVRPGMHRSYKLSLWSIEDQEVILESDLQILANQVDQSESVPTPLAPWGTDLTDIEADIEALQAAILAHDHDGVDAAKVAHGNLTGIGTLTHAAIDAALANLQADLNTHADRLAALEAWRVSATSALTSAADAVAVIQSWKAGAITDLAELQVTAGNLAAQISGVNALAPTDLGWDVGMGEEIRSISSSPSYGTLLKVVRTLVADLKGRHVI